MTFSFSIDINMSIAHLKCESSQARLNLGVHLYSLKQNQPLKAHPAHAALANTGKYYKELKYQKLLEIQHFCYKYLKVV